MNKELSNKERTIIFWASFLALMAAGVGFGIRVMSVPIWEKEFSIGNADAMGLFGQSIWPIAVGMILFSLVVDKIGYRTSMIFAFIFLAGSSIVTLFAKDFNVLKYAFLGAGFGHGIVEAVINPLCATMYKKEKSKMLNILHASWPAGGALGASVFLLLGTGESPVLEWRQMFWFMILPCILFGLGFLACKNYPKDERIENNVSYRDMLKEFGGLGIFIAVTFLFYEFATQAQILSEGYDRILTSLGVGAAAGFISGILIKSPGKILFFILCLIMIPLATAEIATDGAIRKLMAPMLDADFGIDSGWAIVVSSLIMMTLRFFAGVPLKFMNPVTLLLFSSLFSIAGLFMLSFVSGALILLAFVLYGIGQTFYWPTVLGFTSEQFPKGGAMTLNTVSAIGLLTVGIFGFPLLGGFSDDYDAKTVKTEKPALYETHKAPQNFFFWKYDKVDLAKVREDLAIPADGKDLTEEQQNFENAISTSGRKVLRKAAILPAIMAGAFLLIILWYKARGGYKPVHLNEADYSDN